MDTTTATITTFGVIALAAGFYRLLLKSSAPETVNPTRIEFDSPVANQQIQWATSPTLSEAVTRPIKPVEDHQDYHRGSLDGYASPEFNERITLEALSGFVNRVAPVKTGIGTILAKTAGIDEWCPIRYRPGHDALGFMQAWLYLSNGPGGKFCWHISDYYRPKSHPITVTSWGTVGTLDEIKEIASRRAA